MPDLDSSAPTSLAVSVDEAGRLLGVSRDLVYDLVARGEVVAVRLGRRLVVPRKSLDELLAGAGVGPKQQEAQ